MMKRKPSNRTLSMETMETRKLMAANTSVGFVDDIATVETTAPSVNSFFYGRIGLYGSEIRISGTDANDKITVDDVVTSSGKDVFVQIRNLDNNKLIRQRRVPKSSVSQFHISGFDGNDRIELNTNLPSTILGGKGRDFIEGGSSADVIEAGDGDDTVYAGGGNDRILGGKGEDTLQGQSGHDWIFGGEGDDVLAGLTGNDWLFGEGGNDRIDGQDDNDILSGGEGEDIIHGGDGHDRLFGNDGDDKLFGDAGNDRLYGNGGEDKLEGGSGFDWLYGGEGDDELDGGRDNDRMYGDDGDDTLLGDHGNDIMRGGNGNDTLYGGDGTDVIYGENGNDGLFGGRGKNTLRGGGDADRFLTSEISTEDIVVDEADEDAVVEFRNGTGVRHRSTDVTYDSASWTTEEIQGIDVGLAMLHAQTSNTALLEQSNGDTVVFERVGDPDDPNAVVFPAWIRNNNLIYVTNHGVNIGFLDLIAVHEIGHHWDNENDRWDDWRDISDWSRSGGTWSHNDTSDSFAREYGETNPFEDFATYFTRVVYEDNGLSYGDRYGIPVVDRTAGSEDKEEFLDDFFASLR